jgi:hypothetical protein
MRVPYGRVHGRLPMKRKARRQQSKGAIELIEEATHLLRLLPVHYFASYYIGTLPFILGFLYFWSDMSLNAFAHEHIVEGAFLIAILFLWMKCWHVIFADQLSRYIAHEKDTVWTPRKILRLIIMQTTMQPSGLLIIPVAMLAVLPFGWSYAFYQNVTVFGNGETDSIKGVFTKSWHHAKLSQRQNHIVLGIVSIFGLFVFFNISLLIWLIPQLSSTFLGIETVFTRAGLSMLSTTFLAVTCCLVYVLVDPFIKAIYVLRCFYGESLSTGEDLKIELKGFQLVRKTVTLSLIALLFIGGGMTAKAAFASETSYGHQTRKPVISPKEMDQSIRSILNKPEYSWKMPRQKPIEKQDEGILTSFVNKVIDTISGWLRTVKNWIVKIFEWFMKQIDKFFKVETKRIPHTTTEWTNILLYILLMLFIAILTVAVWRVWKTRKGRKPAVMAVTEARIPDIADEHLTADELPTKKWLELARTLMEEGNMRLSLRALYFASLSHLSHHELITIALFKSNRDYERELGRKAHSLPHLMGAFSHNMRIFEQIWYGMHEVTSELVERFKDNQERIMSFEGTF